MDEIIFLKVTTEALQWVSMLPWRKSIIFWKSIFQHLIGIFSKVGNNSAGFWIFIVPKKYHWENSIWFSSFAQNQNHQMIASIILHLQNQVQPVLFSNNHMKNQMTFKNKQSKTKLFRNQSKNQKNHLIQDMFCNQKKRFVVESWN